MELFSSFEAATAEVYEMQGEVFQQALDCMSIFLIDHFFHGDLVPLRRIW